MTWLAAFVWTLVLEYPLYEWSFGGRARRWWHPAAWTLAVNLLTHPALTLWLHASPRPRGELLAAELVVAACEGLALAVLVRPAPGLALASLAALAANGISCAVGLLALSGT